MHTDSSRIADTGAKAEPHQADAKGGFEAFLASREGLVVTHWFDPAIHQTTGTVLVRFSGRRVTESANKKAADHFTHDETVEDVTTGDGPISVTARITEIHAGEWLVTAALINPSRPRSERHGGRHTKPSRAATPLPRATWSWFRRTLGEGDDGPVSTCLVPLAPVPGLVRGLYLALAIVGIALGLAVQQLLTPNEHLGTDHSLLLSVVGIAIGLIGAKAWFIAGHLRDGHREGWCIQGLVTGFAITAIVATATTGLRLGAFLDVSAPGLLFGMAVGRIGCFFAGCCRGKPTSSRFGVWSSDQRIGRRRFPTQLMESALAACIGASALVAVLTGGEQGGAVFVAAIAGYTLCRQWILRLRAGRRPSPRGAYLVVGLTAVILVADVVLAALF